jgi:hypothetical protein
MTQDFVARAQLKAEGWTESLIDRFLGAPDKLKRNPHYSSGAPMQLYDRKRVERMKATDVFQEALGAEAKGSRGEGCGKRDGHKEA